MKVSELIEKLTAISNKDMPVKFNDRNADVRGIEDIFETGVWKGEPYVLLCELKQV